MTELPIWAGNASVKFPLNTFTSKQVLEHKALLQLSERHGLVLLFYSFSLFSLV